MIPEKIYKQIMDLMPILCVDAVIKNNNGQYLLVKRKNKPLQGEWWVVGGRVNKGETIVDAISRKVKEELSVNICNCIPIGYYEDFYKENYFDLKNGAHMISLVFMINIDDDQTISLDDQSVAWKFSKELPKTFLINPFKSDC
jgi:colanic acid biosynthesis protein WcaH